jgi:thiosulfate/3-mercaptopyruvate sulfurtransferase
VEEPAVLTDPPPFVSAAWLAAHRDEVVLVDVRWSLDGRQHHGTYLEGHLPGAVYVDLDADLSAPPSTPGGRHPLPRPEDLAAALGRRGIPDEATVVAYDTASGAVAGRLVWLLRVIGQPAAVLDGGLAAWDGPLETGEVVREPVTRVVRSWPSDRFVDVEEVARLRTAPATAVVDVRSGARFRGEADVDAVPGHIPGARSVPVGRHLDPDGRLLDAPALRARYAEAGVAPDDAVVTSCGSGVSACLALLALETLDVHGRLFPGSWSAWSADPSRPIATGAATEDG